MLVQVLIWESACACTRVVPVMLLGDAGKWTKPFVRFLHSPWKTRVYLAINGCVTCVLSGFLAVSATDYDESHRWISLIEGLQIIACGINAIFLSCSYITIRKVLQAYMQSEWQSSLKGPSHLKTVNDAEGGTHISKQKSLPRKQEGSTMLTAQTEEPYDPMRFETASINREIRETRQRTQTSQNELLRVRLEFAFSQMRNNLAMNVLAFGINLFYVICSRNTNLDARYRVPIFVFVHLLLLDAT